MGLEATEWETYLFLCCGSLRNEEAQRFHGALGGIRRHGWLDLGVKARFQCSAAKADETREGDVPSCELESVARLPHQTRMQSTALGHVFRRTHSRLRPSLLDVLHCVPRRSEPT